VKLLGIETSSAVGSIALTVDGEVLEREIETPREQAELLLKLIDELLATAGVELRKLDAVTFGRGPGSFTGLRVSAAIAQGLALATGVRLVPVSSLLCLAEHAHRSAGVERALVVVDARMGEVYWALYARERDTPVAVGPERLSAPTSVAAPDERSWSGVGDGFGAYREALAGVTASADRVLADLRPVARDLFPAAERARGRGEGGANR
jgi:tRNA threonylcarbamoyladenosine biosynthesis protein TsaB